MSEVPEKKFERSVRRVVEFRSVSRSIAVPPYSATLHVCLVEFVDVVAAEITDSLSDTSPVDA